MILSDGWESNSCTVGKVVVDDESSSVHAPLGQVCDDDTPAAMTKKDGCCCCDDDNNDEVKPNDKMILALARVTSKVRMDEVNFIE